MFDPPHGVPPRPKHIRFPGEKHMDCTPQTADHKQHSSPLDPVADTKQFASTYQHQLCRPVLTSPYKVAETAEKILIQIVGLSQSSDPLLQQTADELIASVAKTSMAIAKALHAEFTKLEDEIELKARETARASIAIEQEWLKNLEVEKKRWNDEHSNSPLHGSSTPATAYTSGIE